MKKRVILLLMALAMTLMACGETRILHCDQCGKEIKVDQNSEMTEDWILFCDECGEEIDASIADMIKGE